MHAIEVERILTPIWSVNKGTNMGDWPPYGTLYPNWWLCQISCWLVIECGKYNEGEFFLFCKNYVFPKQLVYDPSIYISNFISGYKHQVFLWENKWKFETFIFTMRLHMKHNSTKSAFNIIKQKQSWTKWLNNITGR
jgi:hypothetical protein